MSKMKVTDLFFKRSKVVTLVICVVLLSASQLTPLYAQLSPARDLTGTWQSSATGMYYEMDPFGTGIRQADVTATFAMDITQEGNQITITLYLNPISWVTDPAFLQEYGIPGAPPVAGEIDFTGTVSSSSFTAVEQGSQLTSEQLTGTFTTDIITATLSGTAETTDQNGIVVTRTSTPTSAPTQAPTPTPSTTAPTPTPTSTPALPTAADLGSVALVKGPAWFTNSGASVTAQSQIGTGTEVLTGNNAIIGFSYPDQGGIAYLDANSDAGWVYLQPQTTPNGQTSYTVVPSPTGFVPFETGLEADELGQACVTLPIEVGIAVLLLGETLPAALLAGVVVEGVLLLPTGIAYIQESLSSHSGTYDVRPVEVPQGLVMGDGTSYVVAVSDSATTIQVLSGSVIFVDRYTNNTITIASNQMLTLPSGQQNGFSEQDLQSDVSSFNPASINQWWTQTTPSASPLDYVNNVLKQVTQPVGNMIEGALGNSTSSGFVSFLFVDQPVVLAFFVLAVIIAIAAVAVARRRRKGKKHTSRQDQPAETPKTPVEPSAGAPANKGFLFCPSCGNRLPFTKKFCPFCGSSLSKQTESKP